MTKDEVRLLYALFESLRMEIRAQNPTATPEAKTAAIKTSDAAMEIVRGLLK